VLSKPLSKNSKLNKSVDTLKKYTDLELNAISTDKRKQKSISSSKSPSMSKSPVSINKTKIKTSGSKSPNILSNTKEKPS
jgi:hypothetical protein